MNGKITNLDSINENTKNNEKNNYIANKLLTVLDTEYINYEVNNNNKIEETDNIKENKDKQTIFFMDL